MAGPSGQPAPRFSPWQGSLVMSRGGHGLRCQDRPGLAWGGAQGGIRWAARGGDTWGQACHSCPQGPGTGSHPLCFLPCATLPGQEHLGLLSSQGTPAGEGPSSRVAATRVWPGWQAVRQRELLSCPESPEPGLHKLVWGVGALRAGALTAVILEQGVYTVLKL